MNSTELPKKRTHIRNHNSNAVLQYRLEQALKHPTLADSPQKQRVLQFIVDDFDDFDDFDNDPANPANRQPKSFATAEEAAAAAAKDAERPTWQKSFADEDYSK